MVYLQITPQYLSWIRTPPPNRKENLLLCPNTESPSPQWQWGTYRHINTGSIWGWTFPLVEEITVLGRLRTGWTGGFKWILWQGKKKVAWPVAISFTTKLSGPFFVHYLIYNAETRINYIFGGIPWKIYRCISRLPAEDICGHARKSERGSNSRLRCSNRISSRRLSQIKIGYVTFILCLFLDGCWVTSRRYFNCSG